MPAHDGAEEFHADPEAERALMAIGVPAEQARAACAAATPVEQQHLTVWRWHLNAVRLFSAMRTQWRASVSPHGALVYVGLDYAALPVVEERLGLAGAVRGELFEQLRMLERAGRRLLNGQIPEAA